MPRRVLIKRANDSFDLVEAAAPSEQSLQEIMKSNPQLIPSDDLGLEGDLLVVGRETQLASGAIDLLCLSRSGEVVLIEFKTGPKNPDFRHALAQVIDYGSDLWRTSVDAFDRGVVQAYLKSPHHQHSPQHVSGLDSLLDASGWQLEEGEREVLLDRLAAVLETGDFIFVVAAQRFTSAMHSSVSYLNSTMRFGRFYLVEIVRLEGEDLVGHTAQVVAAPSAAKTSGSSSKPGPNGTTNQAVFLAAITDPDYRDAMHDVLARCSALGLTLGWGTKGTSIRIQTSDPGDPLSIGWAFLEGDHFFGARNLTFGVDQNALESRPSVKEEVLMFVRRISQIPHAQPVPTKLNAYTFLPSHAAQAKEAILATLGQLITDMQSKEDLKT